MLTAAVMVLVLLSAFPLSYVHEKERHWERETERLKEREVGGQCGLSEIRIILYVNLSTPYIAKCNIMFAYIVKGIVVIQDHMN